MKNHLAGEVNSPIPIPIYYPSDIVKGEGPYVFNKNGDKYIDMWMGYGALLFGHLDQDVIQTINNSIKNGWFFSYQTYIEKELSSIIHEIIPSAEKIRFATTGSDAVAYSIRASKCYTKRQKVLSIIGGYHGVHEGMITSAGVLDNQNLTLVPFNDISAVDEKLRNNEYACFILEPILANSGCTPPHENYLKEIRKICNKTGTILIFDEIVTGFRVSIHGAQGLFNVTPDLSLFSKAIAGGLPLSVVCGKREIMENFIPTGNVFFAGTFNANPLSLNVSKTIINKLKTTDFYKETQELGDDLRNFIKEQISKLQIPACVQGMASMLTIAFGCSSFEKGIKLETCNDTIYNFFIEEMAKRHVLFPPLPTETVFLSPVHKSVIKKIKEAIKQSLKMVKDKYYK